MEVINGEWYIKGLSWEDPYRIRSHRELVKWIKEVGFLPLFSGEVEGFSAEEHVSPNFWWTGDPDQDPWEWRELIAREGEVAYGKFFGGRAGFISLEWLPRFANFRRNGFDFDSRWEEGLANRREKLIMDQFMEPSPDGDIIWKDKEILTTDLKRICGFGKGGEKNFPGITTGLMMQTYLVITDFRRRVSKKGQEYGMPVSIMQPPERVWGYDLVTAAYSEAPRRSWEQIAQRIRDIFPDASQEDIVKTIGKAPD